MKPAVENGPRERGKRIHKYFMRLSSGNPPTHPDTPLALACIPASRKAALLSLPSPS